MPIINCRVENTDKRVLNAFFWMNFILTLACGCWHSLADLAGAVGERVISGMLQKPQECGICWILPVESTHATDGAG